MRRGILSVLGTRRKRTGAAVALLLLVAAIATGMAMVGEHGRDIKDSFYQSVSYNPDEGVLRFTIPRETPEGQRFYLHISGRVLMGDGSSGMSFHAFDQESESFSWASGRTYTYSLQPDNLDHCLLVFGLVDQNNRGRLYDVTVAPDGTKSIEDAD